MLCRYCTWVLLLLCTLYGLGVPVFASERLTFASGLKHPKNQIATEILEKAYNKLGIEIEIKAVPVARSFHIARAGAVDGELFRGKELANASASLVRIPVALFYEELVVFTHKDKSIVIDGWDSLVGYRVGSHSGLKEVEAQRELIDLSMVNHPLSLFNMLIRDRLDVVVLPRHVGQMLIQESNLKSIGMLQPPVERYGLYHHLHIKQADLVEPITTVLEQMLESGELAALRDSHATNKKAN